MKKVFITLLTSLVLTSAYANTVTTINTHNTKNLKASNDYQYVGLQGDTVTAIYVDPTTGGILAAGPDENAVLSLYYSKDGQSFNSLDLSQFSNLGSNVYALAALNSTAGVPIIFIGTEKGLFAATINGTTLSIKNIGNITFQVNAITVINAKTMAVATAHGLYVTTDGGISFYQNDSLGGSGSPAIAGIAQNAANVYIAYSGVDGFQPAIVVKTAPKASFVSNNPKFVEKAYIDVPPSLSNNAVSIYADPNPKNNVVDVVMNYTGLQQTYQEVHQCTVPADSSLGACHQLYTLSVSDSSSLHTISCAGLLNASGSTSTTYCAADQGLFVSSDDGDDFTNTTEGQYSFYTDFGTTFYPQSIFSNGKNVYANLIDVNSNVSAGIYKIA